MRIALFALPLVAALPAQAQTPHAVVPMQVLHGAVVPQGAPLEQARQGQADRCMGLAWRLSGRLVGRTPAEADRILRDEAVQHVYLEPGTRNAYPAEGTLIVGLDASGHIDRLGCAGWTTVRSQD